MPHVFATFGWIACLLILAIAIATGLSGSVFGELCGAVADAETLAHISSEAYHSTGGRLAASFVAVTKLAVCLVFQHAAATALQHTLKGVMPQGGMVPLWAAWTITRCAVLLAVQLPHMEQLSWLCYIGNVSQLVAAGLMCACVLTKHHRASTCMVEAGPHSWTHQMVTVLSLVFAFGGQYAFVEVAHHMADRQAFARVQQAATCIMAGLYIAFGAIVYAVQGRAATELAVFAADDLHALGRAVVVCVLLQTFVQLSLSVYLWTATFLRLCAAGKEPATLPMAQLPHVQVYPAVAANACSLHTRGDSAASMVCDPVNPADSHKGFQHVMHKVVSQMSGCLSRLGEQHPGFMSHMCWLLASAGSIVLIGVVSTVVPSIQHLVGIVAAGTYIMLAYGLPCLFAAALLAGTYSPFVLWFLKAVVVVSVLISPLGVAASVLSFVQGST
jgi:vesicular inhibitory amino acid transporter